LYTRAIRTHGHADLYNGSSFESDVEVSAALQDRVREGSVVKCDEGALGGLEVHLQVRLNTVFKHAEGSADTDTIVFASAQEGDVVNVGHTPHFRSSSGLGSVNLWLNGHAEKE